MVDLWDALALVAAGGVLSLVTGIVIQILSTRANRESEERQAQRRVEEEQRQVIRQRRRERMQPVVDFLELSKRRFASRTVGGLVAKAVEKFPPQKEEVEQLKHRATGDEPDYYELLRLYAVAAASSLSIPALLNELEKISHAQGDDADPETAGQWGLHIASAEALIEQYVAAA